MPKRSFPSPPQEPEQPDMARMGHPTHLDENLGQLPLEPEYVHPTAEIDDSLVPGDGRLDEAPAWVRKLSADAEQDLLDGINGAKVLMNRPLPDDPEEKIRFSLYRRELIDGAIFNFAETHKIPEEDVKAVFNTLMHQPLTEGARIARGMDERERVKLLTVPLDDAEAKLAARYGPKHVSDIIKELNASYSADPDYYAQAITRHNTTDAGGWMARLRGTKDKLMGGAGLNVAKGFEAVGQGIAKANEFTSEKFTEADPNNPNSRRMSLKGKALLLGIGAVGAAVALVAGDSMRGGGHGPALADSIDPSAVPTDTPTSTGIPKPSAPTTPSVPETSVPTSTPNTDTPFIPEPPEPTAPTPSPGPTPAPVEPQPVPGGSAPNPANPADAAPASPNAPAPAPAATETVTVHPGESVYEIGHSRGLTDTQIANGIKDGTIIGHNPDGSVISNLNNINPGDHITFGTEASQAPSTPAAAPNAPAPLDVHAPAPADAIHLSKGGSLSESIQDLLQNSGRSDANVQNATQAVMDYNQSLGVNLTWESARQIQATNVGGTTVATLPAPHSHVPQLIHMPPPDVFDRLMEEAARKTTR